MLLAYAKNERENLTREQGRRRPTGPTRALLRIVDARPRLAMEALHADRLAA